MKKAVLLWILSLAMGFYTHDVQAQEDAPKERIRIIIEHEQGKTEVYEYNSREAMEADERLKGMDLRMPDEKEIRLRLLDAMAWDSVRLNASPMHIASDSMRLKVRRIFANRDSSVLGPQHKIFMLREPHEMRALTKEMRDLMSEQGVRDVKIFNHRPFVMEDLPEASRKLLEENGLKLKEGERVVILRETDELPVPPAIPQMPGLPAPPAEAPTWLEDLKVYPNPADDQLRVQFRSKTAGPAILRLTDLNGKEVYKEDIADAATMHDKTITLPADQKGIFLLQLEQEGKIYTQRLILK